MSSLITEMPVAGADSVPFVVRSYADAKRLWRWQRPVVERAFASMGVVVLYAVPWPPQGLYTMRPLGSLAELRGSRMRSYNRSTARIAELLGCSAVEVPMSDVGQALADGPDHDSLRAAVVPRRVQEAGNHPVCDELRGPERRALTLLLAGGSESRNEIVAGRGEVREEDPGTAVWRRPRRGVPIEQQVRGEPEGRGARGQRRPAGRPQPGRRREI